MDNIMDIVMVIFVVFSIFGFVLVITKTFNIIREMVFMRRVKHMISQDLEEMGLKEK